MLKMIQFLKISSVFIFISLLTIIKGSAQKNNFCSFFIKESDIDNLIINPNVVNVNNQSRNYYYPLDEIKKYLRQIIRSEIPVIIDKSLQSNLDSLSTFKSQIQVKFDFYTDSVKQMKVDFNNEIKRLKEFYEQIKADTSISNNPKSKELLFTTGEILKSAEFCLSSDFELISTNDNLGNTRYGFSLEKLKDDPNYILIEDFHNGLARVKQNNKWGFIDTNGDFVISPQYDSVSLFLNTEVAIAKNANNYFLINKKGVNISSSLKLIKKITLLNYGNFIFMDSKNVYYLVDSNGKKMSDNYYWIDDRSDFKDLLRAKTNKGENVLLSTLLGETVLVGKFGLINENGINIIKPEYKLKEGFDQNGYVIIEDNAGNIGIINQRGEYKVRFNTYCDIATLYNEYKAVCKNCNSIGAKKYGVVDVLTNKMVLPYMYNRIEYRYFLFCDFDVYYISDDGIVKTKIISLSNENFVDSTSVIRVSTARGIYTGNYKVARLVTFSLEDLKNNIIFERRIGNTSLYKSEYGLYLHNKDEIIYVDNIDGFILNNNIILLQSSKTMQLFDLDLKEVSLPYDTIMICSNNMYVTKMNSKYGFLNPQGEAIVQPKYTGYENRLWINNTMIVDIYLQYGVINSNGLEFIPPIFDDISRVDRGFQLKKGPNSFEINYQGECISNNREQYKELLRNKPKYLKAIRWKSVTDTIIYNTK